MTKAFRMAAAALSILALSCTKGRAPARELKAGPASRALTSDCTGVIPDSAALASHYDIVQGIGTTSSCAGQEGDGSGSIATQVYTEVSDVNIVTTRDEGSGEVYGTIFAPRELLPQNEGFEALTGTHAAEALKLRAYDGDSTLRGEALISPRVDHAAVHAVAVDPTGGALVVLSQPTASGWALSGQLFDDYAHDNSGKQVVASGAGYGPQFVVAGVDLLGNALIAWDGRAGGYPSGTLLGLWMDQGGSFLTGTFVVASGLDTTGFTRFLPLADNEGLALQNKGRWLAQIPDLSTTPGAPPAFLATRPDHSFALIRSGNAYAVWSDANFDLGTCEQKVEAFASAGNKCGQVSLRSAPGVCAQDRIKVTRDGTAIDLQRGAHSCTWKVFPLLWN